MIKTYVCPHCKGTGQIWALDENNELDIMVTCPVCVELGLPAKITLKGGTKQGANEMEVEATFSVVVPLQMKETP